MEATWTSKVLRLVPVRQTLQVSQVKALVSIYIYQRHLHTCDNDANDNNYYHYFLNFITLGSKDSEG